MWISNSVLRALGLAPAFAFSGLALLATLALVPAAATLPVVAAVAVSLSMMTRAPFETIAVHLLTWSRSPTEAEEAVLQAARVQAGQAAAVRTVVLVRRSGRDSHPTALAFGRRLLVVSPRLIAAVDQGRVSPVEAATLLVHAHATHRVGSTRCDVAVFAATAPWRMAGTIARGVAVGFAALPLVRFAWTCRGWLAVIDVELTLTQGQLVARSGGAAVVVLTYVLPMAERTLQARSEAGADRDVIDLGLGPTLLAYLERAGAPLSSDRRRRLAKACPDPTGAPGRPRLTAFSA